MYATTPMSHQQTEALESWFSRCVVIVVVLLLLRGLEPTVIQKHFAIVLLSCVVMNVFTCLMWTIVAHRACWCFAQSPSYVLSHSYSSWRHSLGITSDSPWIWWMKTRMSSNMSNMKTVLSAGLKLMNISEFMVWPWGAGGACDRESPENTSKWSLWRLFSQTCRKWNNIAIILKGIDMMLGIIFSIGFFVCCIW